MGRSPCCDENGLKKGPWTPEEDQKLVEHIQKHGHGSWRALPKLAGLNRCGKSCRLRWTNYLRPDIKRGKFSQEEEQTILHLHSILGNKWSAIATHLPGRTDNEIKNFWNTHLKKKLIQMGFDPMTHQPRTDLVSTLPYLLALANNMTELMDHHHSWDEAEAVQLAKLQYLNYLLQSSNSLNTNVVTNNNSSSSCAQNVITNVEPSAFNNLLSTMSHVKENLSGIDNPTPTSFSDQGIVGAGSSSQPLHQHQSMLLLPPHHDKFLNPQVSFSYSQSCLNNKSEEQGQGSTNFAMISQEGDLSPEEDTLWINIPSNIINPQTAIGTSASASNLGDASSSSSTSTSYGTVGGQSSYWSELFLDQEPILHDLS